MLRGAFTGASAEAVGGIFNDMLAQPGPQIFWMIVAVVLGFGVCSLGLQNGVEKITKSHDGLPAAADGGAGCA